MSVLWLVGAMVFLVLAYVVIEIGAWAVGGNGPTAKGALYSIVLWALIVLSFLAGHFGWL